MNYLVVDMGNFLTKWGVCSVYSDGQRCWHITESVLTRNSSIILQSWDNLSPHHFPDYVVVSNVSRDSSEQIVSFVRNRWNKFTYQVVSTSEYKSLKNLYENPDQLGSDRWAAAVAAYSLFSSEFTVIFNCGTALTADVIGDGFYWGGTVIPGFYWLGRGLLDGTALFLDDLDFSTRVPSAFLDNFPQNTNTAVKVGICDSVLGWSQCTLERVKKKFQIVPRIIISGGSGEFLYNLWMSNFSTSACYIDTLVLDGLVCLARDRFD